MLTSLDRPRHFALSRAVQPDRFDDLNHMCSPRDLQTVPFDLDNHWNIECQPLRAFTKSSLSRCSFGFASSCDVTVTKRQNRSHLQLELGGEDATPCCWSTLLMVFVGF